MRQRVASGAIIGIAAAANTLVGVLSGPLGPAVRSRVDELAHPNTNPARLAMARGAATPSPIQASTSATSHAALEPLRSAVALDAPRRLDRTYSRPLVKKILEDAAVRHQLEPRLVLAIAYWESGWDQSQISSTGAVGLMQVEPASAETAGPKLLGRQVELTDAYDNADVGAAIFREDLENFGDPGSALAAYYQGPSSLRENGMLPDTLAYVAGIMALAGRLGE
jgi:soluble lytic murein transglycosylase-like protein